MSRARRHLSPPPQDLREFPDRIVTPTRHLWRIHWADKGAWWFCSDLLHRFDLPHAMGTCHVAESPLGSFVEVFTEISHIAREDIDARRLSDLHLPRRARLADCTDARARGFGCTGEIHTTDDYDLTQAWATAFRAAGFGGVRYLVRHDPSQRETGIAIFGDEGEPAGWMTPKASSIPESVITAASRHFGIRVLPAP